MNPDTPDPDEPRADPGKIRISLSGKEAGLRYSGPIMIFLAAYAGYRELILDEETPRMVMALGGGMAWGTFLAWLGAEGVEGKAIVQGTVGYWVWKVIFNLAFLAMLFLGFYVFDQAENFFD